jgi:hypothetical protein
VYRTSDERDRFAGSEIDEIRSALAVIVGQGGPTADDYPRLQCLMDRISTLRADGAISEAMNDALWESLGEVGSTQTLMGFIYRKPHGYHGDFEIIDKFYNNWVNPEPRLSRWDRWIQSLECTRAVRNRKDYFRSIAGTEAHIRRTMNILNVGSGPCRDLLELLNSLSVGALVRTTCVDIDTSAITFARNLLGSYGNSIEFVQTNVLRFGFVEQFDLVWSAGLFDYLNDRLFVAALRRMFRAAKFGCKVVIGNFSSNNPGRSAMEWGNWRLNHRSPDHLRSLVAEAKLGHSNLCITSEALGVNLFVEITK